MSRTMIRTGSASCARTLSAPRTHQLHLRDTAVNGDAVLIAPCRHHRRWPAAPAAGWCRGIMSWRPGQALYSTKKPVLVEENMPPNWRQEVQASLAKVDRAANEEALKALLAKKTHLEDLEEALSNEDLRPDAPWGVAVYRTSYDDEAAWQKMRENLEAEVVESMECYVDNGLSERHQFVFMDDKAQFDGASPYEIRDHFSKWAREALTKDWAKQPVREEMLHKDIDRTLDTAGTRYNVCMVVDDVSLLSLSKDTLMGPLTMLVNRRLGPPVVEPPTDEDHQHPDYADGWMYDHNEGYGGWVYSSTAEYVDNYNMLNDCNVWEENWMFGYPSMVYDKMGLERSPAFWRDEIAAGRAEAAVNEQ